MTKHSIADIVYKKTTRANTTQATAATGGRGLATR